jgi:broad-specificity NMP kinase
MKKFNVLYNGRKIYKNLSAEECTEVLQELSEKFYSDEEFDLSLIEMEEI